MENKSYLPKAEEFMSNQIKECPYCNAIIPLSEYEDHILCHQLDEQENGEQGFNVNNYGFQNNNLGNNNDSNINSNHGNMNSININNNSNNINNNNQGQSNFQESQNLNNINIINENNNQSNISGQNKINFLDKIKNYFKPSNNNNNNQNNNKRDIMKIPIENLSPEEREERNKIEEQKAYEKKILGIAKADSDKKVEDNRSTGEKVSDFIHNNSNSILAVIDVIGCLTLHTPSIGRTIVRISNFIGNQINNSGNTNQNNNNNINNESDEFNNIVRNHPELKNKDNDPDTIIKFLPVSEIKEIKQNPENSTNNNNKCIICLSEFEIGDQVSALPCAHVFHTLCISSWIKKHCQCPVCKFNITLRSLIG